MNGNSRAVFIETIPCAVAQHAHAMPADEAHSPLMPAALMIGPHFSISDL
jgi:hypothetical protein